MSKPLEKITKEYPKRGPLSQYRFEKTIAFKCFRCSQTKTSKLITLSNNNWDRRLCNGCYGRLLSIYDIKAGQQNVEDKVEQLLQVLTNLVNESELRTQTQRLQLQSNKVDFLSPVALRFFATSEFVAKTLTEEPNLDWSPAIIGLCKAFELEIIERFINPFKVFCQSINFAEQDLKDKDFGKVASYCSGKPIKSPELGVISHFVLTAVNSKERLENSDFLNLGFKSYINRLPNNNWIVDKNGLVKAIENLTRNFRNKAAHTDELGEQDYQNCKNLVFGEHGIMWELIISTEFRK